MEAFFVLIGLAVLSLPVMAIIAVIRTSSLRQDLNSLTETQTTAARDLRIEVATLKRILGETQSELARLKAAAAAPPAAPSAPAAVAPTPVAVPPQPASATPVPAAPIPAKPLPTASPAAAPVAPPISPLHAAASHSLPTPTAPLRNELPTRPPIAPSAPMAPPPPARPQPVPSMFSTPAPEPPQPERPAQPSLFARLSQNLPLEALLGMNLFAKIGIVLLVLGFALLGRMALVAMGPAGKVALIDAIGAALLGGGIWLERNERYRLIGRTGIGGGWALLFFTTYAMQHVAAMQVLHSATLDCVLLLVVAVATTVHTLRYNSQLVTGLAFLLGFSTVALTQDTVYALSAGVVLALGIVFVALRKRWYELEIFGILASFANHFYWLHNLYPAGFAGHTFPQFWPSTLILLLYWLTFRISYVVRRVDTPREERSSTIAALTNTVLLLGVMKFQSTRPELAFYALAALGAVEFAFGQLPITRRRRAAFTLLSVLGTMLLFAAVPFKYSGNSIALVWMIAAEALLVAGIVQRELVFRRLGLIAGILTGALVAYESQSLLALRLHSEARLTSSGVQLLLCAAIFYANALWIRARWKELFADLDQMLLTAESYLGAALAILGVWALFPGDATAVGWAALLLLTAAGLRRLRSPHLLLQSAVLSAIVVLRAAITNTHLDLLAPHHLPARIATLLLLAAALYTTALLVNSYAASQPETTQPASPIPAAPLAQALRAFTLLAASTTLVALAYLELPAPWVALAWLGLAAAFATLGRRLRVLDLCLHEHALALGVALRLVLVNMQSASPLECYLPVLAAAAVFYALSRRSTLADSTYGPAAAWAHSWLATGLLATLAWYRADEPWLAALWALFALTLAAIDRIAARALTLDELPWQAHVLALLTLLRIAAVNLWLETTWHGISLRLITLAIVAVAFYALTYVIRLRESERALNLHHLYSAAASFLVAWLTWKQLVPMAVADGFALFGLALFLSGQLLRQKPLRLQGYALLAAAFLRLGIYNLVADLTYWHGISTRVLSTALVIVLSLGVWFVLDRASQASSALERRLGAALAWLSTLSLAGLLLVELDAVWIVVAWSALALVLLTAAWLLRRELFLRQAALLLVTTVVQGLYENVFTTHAAASFWRDDFHTLLVACAILLAALPLALVLRSRYAEHPLTSEIDRALHLDRIEQWVFFAPILLLTLGVVMKVSAGAITLAWALEGLAAVLLGLLVAQRSFRVAGLVLLLLCVAKIVFRDAWQLSERDRYITFIALGAALMLVSVLYNKYRETVLKLL